MNLVPWKSRDNWGDPFDAIDDIQREVNKLYNWPGVKNTAKHPMAGLWTPTVDIFDEKNQIRIKADLPGMSKDQIDVSADDGVLTIKGEKKDEKESKEKNCVRTERYYGSFLRSFILPAGADTQKISAAYTNGVLEVIVPKKEEAKANQVKIEIK